MPESCCDGLAHRPLIVQNRIRLGQIEPDTKGSHDQEHDYKSGHLQFEGKLLVGAVARFFADRVIGCEEKTGNNAHHNACDDHDSNEAPEVSPADTEEFLTREAIVRSVSGENTRQKQGCGEKKCECKVEGGQRHGVQASEFWLG